ncbi:MAG TPA: hypothetical protein VGC05_04405 [Mycobacterium sp.]
MRIVTALPGSGTLGGVVATHSRSGSRFHVRSAHTQPRSPAQVSARALTGSLPGLWRTLSSEDRSGWGSAARSGQSGYSLFVGNNRRLLTIGAAPITQAPAAAPAFPAIQAFAVTAIYSQAEEPRALVLWQLTPLPAFGAGFGVVARASQPLSPGRAYFHSRELRTVATSPDTASPLIVPASSWVKAWGIGPGSGSVVWEIELVDPATGYAAPPARAVIAYAAQLPPSLAPWETTLQQDGSTIAVTTGTIYMQEGAIVAGP